MFKSLTFVFFVIFFLSACGGEKKISRIDNPTLVVIAFFEAIYNEKDIKKAASVCSPKLSRLLLHYKTSQSVARHLFNMSYDQIIDISPDDPGVKIREIFKDKAIITVYISGRYDNNIVKNVKRLSLIQNKDERWVIDKILKDPF